MKALEEIDNLGSLETICFSFSSFFFCFFGSKISFNIRNNLKNGALSVMELLKKYKEIKCLSLSFYK